jgi:hypothetical protein
VLQALLLPDYRAITYPGLAVSFVAELGLALWLLVKGVKVADSGAGLPGEKRDVLRGLHRGLLVLGCRSQAGWERSRCGRGDRSPRKPA